MNNLDLKQERDAEIARLQLEGEVAEIATLLNIETILSTVSFKQTIEALEGEIPMLSGDRASKFNIVLQNMQVAAEAAKQDAEILNNNHARALELTAAEARLAALHTV
jgi:hypothetical protein